MTVSVPLRLVSLKCCSDFESNWIFGSVNPIKILISLSMLGYPFEGIFGHTGCSRYVLFIFAPKKVPTTNRASEWSSVPNILEPFLIWPRGALGLPEALELRWTSLDFVKFHKSEAQQIRTDQRDFWT